MHLILSPSEAPLSSILKNWQKSLFFHEYLPKGLTNFGCWKLKLHTLNYHSISSPGGANLSFHWRSGSIMLHFIWTRSFNLIKCRRVGYQLQDNFLLDSWRSLRDHAPQCQPAWQEGVARRISFVYPMPMCDVAPHTSPQLWFGSAKYINIQVQTNEKIGRKG